MSTVAGVGIAFVNNFAGPGMGGGEVHLLNIAAACRDAGMRVHVICEPGGALAAEARDAGFTVAPYRLGRPNVLRTVSRIRKYLVREGIALAHSGGVLANVLVRLACRGLPVGVVTTVQVEPDAALHDGGSRAGVALRRALERATRSRTDRYVAISHAVAAAIEADGVPGDRIDVVHNGVRVADLLASAAGEVPPAVASVCGPLVGCVARLVRVKGVDVFIDAAHALAGSHATFVVVGDGPESEALKRRAADGPAADRILFTGALGTAAPVLRRLSAVAVPSRSEGQSILAVEAMALGVPVVASAVGGLPEVVQDGVTGLLVPADDSAALAAAIGRLLDDPALAGRLGAAGLARATDHFSLDDQTAAYLEVFRSLL